MKAQLRTKPSSASDSKWAALISSTRTTKRPFSLVELASIVEDAIREAGSLESAADRISLSPGMLRQFSLAKRLDPSVKPLVETRKIDSVDAVGYLVLLGSADQQFVAKELAEKRILTSDLRAIRDQRRVMPNASIGSIVKRVKDSRSEQVYVVEFAIRGGLTKEAVGKRIATTLGPGLIAGVEIEGVIGRVLFKRSGRDELKAFAKAEGVALSKALPKLLYQS